MTETTPEKDPETGRFLPGNSGFGGRPKGARAKLGEAFIAALHDDFQKHGIAAVEKVRAEKPDAYLKVIASLMPKDMNLNINPAEDMTDEQLIKRIRSLSAAIQPFLDPEGAGDFTGGTEAPTIN